MKRKQTKKYKSCPAYQSSPNAKQFSKAITLLETLLDQHRKLLVCRINLTAAGLDGHKDIAALIRKIKQDYETDFYGFIWTCEYKQSIGKHYHIAIFLNGSKFKDDVSRMERYVRYWTLKTGMYAYVSIFDPKKGNIKTTGLLARDDTEKFDDVTYGLSYLCKTSQKLDSTERNFNMNQIKSLIDKENNRKAA